MDDSLNNLYLLYTNNSAADGRNDGIFYRQRFRKSRKCLEKGIFSGNYGDGSFTTKCNISIYVLVLVYGYLPVALD
jgi:hypothetical protein